MCEDAGVRMAPRFPESPEERAQRLARLARRLGEPVGGLDHRLAARLAAAQPALAGVPALAHARQIVADGLNAARRLTEGDWKPTDLTALAMANLEAVIRVESRPAWLLAEGLLVIPEDPASEFWIVHANNVLNDLEATCAKVGCIFKDGAPIGNFPQAFSHVGLITAALSLEAAHAAQ